VASLSWEIDPHSATGSLLVRSESPAVLAGIPDALVQTLPTAGDVATIWALHPSEQTGIRDVAYQHEREELGHGAAVDIVEMARPRERNVVWVDRYHLLARTNNLASVARVLGLYVGSGGQLVAYVHHASVSAAVDAAVLTFPHSGTAGWDDPILNSQCRFGLRLAPKAPNQIELTSGGPLRPQIDAGLRQYSALVAGW
jgi:hypothetical protein